MGSKHSFYLMTANNGGMIAGSWEQTCRCARYLQRGRKVKGFDDWDEAQHRLWDHLSEVAPLWCQLPDRFKIGKVYTIKSLIAENENRQE